MYGDYSQVFVSPCRNVDVPIRLQRCRHVRCWNLISDCNSHGCILEGRRFGTPESVGLPVWLIAVGALVENPAFTLPESSRSARTYCFSSPLHLLVDPILLRTSYIASLAYQRFEGKGER